MRRCENNTQSAKKKTRLLAHHSPELHNRWTGCTAACRVRGYYGERNLQSKHILPLSLSYVTNEAELPVSSRECGGDMQFSTAMKFSRSCNRSRATFHRGRLRHSKNKMDTRVEITRWEITRRIFATVNTRYSRAVGRKSRRNIRLFSRGDASQRRLSRKTEISFMFMCGKVSRYGSRLRSRFLISQRGSIFTRRQLGSTVLQAMTRRYIIPIDSKRI